METETAILLVSSWIRHDTSHIDREDLERFDQRTGLLELFGEKITVLFVLFNKKPTRVPI